MPINFDEKRWLYAASIACWIIGGLNAFLLAGFFLVVISPTVYVWSQVVAAICFGVIGLGLLALGLWQKIKPALPAAALFILMAILEAFANALCKHPIFLVMIWYGWVFTGFFVLWSFIMTRARFGRLAISAGVAFFLFTLIRAVAEFWIILTHEYIHSLYWNAAAILLFVLIATYFRKLGDEYP
jgi:hypothetical protein